MLIQVSTTSQTLLMLLDLLMQRMATLICTLFPPALLDQPWAVFSNKQKKNNTPQQNQTKNHTIRHTIHQSHGDSDLHLQIYIIMLLSFPHCSFISSLSLCIFYHASASRFHVYETFQATQISPSAPDPVGTLVTTHGSSNH